MFIGFDNPTIVNTTNKHQKYRFQLVVIVLSIVLITILGIGTILSFQDFDAAGYPKQSVERSAPPWPLTWRPEADSALHRYQLELAMIAQAEKREFREFFLKICHLVLLNLMLPMLTAMLAFKMGSVAQE